jgi:antitoxin (DNA-binding transcriptional repressor) of toxin-antitoxin stability system
MRTVNIAELKDQLSACLHRVRAGEELLIRDRKLPIAKIVPLNQDEIESEELSLVASGQMTLPKKRFRENQFWAIGSGLRFSPKLSKAIDTAIETEREERDARLLGHKRNHSHLRARLRKQ